MHIQTLTDTAALITTTCKQADNTKKNNETENPG